MMVYWDPLVMCVERLPTCRSICKTFCRVLPFLGFFSSFGWLGFSWYINAQYIEGKCLVHALPKEYITTGAMEPLVSGLYTVRRYFEPTNVRPEGYIIQECTAKVPCIRMDYGPTGAQDDDMC